jgi:hypothetical protein
MTNLQKLNRQQRKELMRQVNTDDPGLEIVHPNAAGIDVGNASHYVAISPSRDPEPVRQFGCFTEDLRRLAEWLKSRGVDTVADAATVWKHGSADRRAAFAGRIAGDGG